MVQPDRLGAEFQNLRSRVGHQEERTAGTDQPLDAQPRLGNKIGIPSTKHLVDDEDVWIYGRRGRKHQTSLHASRVCLEWLVYEVAQLGKFDYILDRGALLRLCQPVILQ